MKFVVIFTIYIICFISSSTGLKCHQCDDASQHYSHCRSDHVVKVCDERRTFCVSAVVKTGQEEGPYRSCEENKCLLKYCGGRDVCTEPGTYELEASYGNFTLTCCKRDLCNNISSVHLCKKNLLLNVLFVSLFLFAS